MYANYRSMPSVISKRLPFKSSSCRAIDENGSYKIYSYRTLIYEENNKGDYYFNYERFSRTTGRLQNIIRNTLSLGDYGLPRTEHKGNLYNSGLCDEQGNMVVKPVGENELKMLNLRNRFINLKEGF